MSEPDLFVEYSAAHPKGRVICDMCLKWVPWPAYNSHVADCFRTPSRQFIPMPGPDVTNVRSSQQAKQGVVPLPKREKK